MIRPQMPAGLSVAEIPSVLYAPALTLKYGERAALQNLAQNHRELLQPILIVLKRATTVKRHPESGELIQPPTLEVHIQRQCDTIAAMLGTSLFGSIPRASLDLRNLDRQTKQSNLAAVERALSAGNHSYLSPVIYAAQDVSHQNAVRKWHQRYKSGCTLNLRRNSFGWPTPTDALRCASDTKIARDRIDLVIDAGSVIGADIEALSTEAANVIEGLGKDWRSTTLLAGSFPRSINGLEPDHYHHLPRLDFMLWENVGAQLAKKGIPKPVFGDYGMVYPFPADGGLQPVPNFRYALGRHWVVLRKDCDAAMRVICSAISGEDWFAGASFSDGDKWVDDVANRRATLGNGAVWTRNGWNRHITCTLDQLTSGS